ncbi:MAG: hypothetical protein ACERKT_06055 [Acidobacteriota bacterium]
MARVLACVDDLMLASRVGESLKAAGHEVEFAPCLPDSTDSDLIVCDLEICDAAAVAGLEPPSIGFYSHLDTETRAGATSAGVDLVIPRSRMSRELPALVDRLLGPG